MHAETYTLILPYFQYICKLFRLQIFAKKNFLENKGIFRQFKFAFFTFEYTFNLYIILLYFCSIYT